MVSSALSVLLSGKNLKPRESLRLFSAIFRGRVPEQAVKTILVLLAKKGETAEEVRGCLDAVQKLEPRMQTGISGLMDTCGTGGDQSRSLNISTLAAIVAAGGGAKIAKHGNRAFSSRCGSSDLMEALGVRLSCSPAKMVRSIRKHGIGYFHAPFYHPVMARFQKLRQELKIKTIFNLLGPLNNPFRLEYQLVGVADPNTFKIYSEVLKKSSLKRALVVCSRDGLDEISCSAPTQAAWIEKGKIKYFTLRPGQMGLRKVPRMHIQCASTARSKQKSLQILKGRGRNAAADVILINAGAALWVSRKARSLKEGIEKARRALETGKAYQALQGLVRTSQS